MKVKKNIIIALIFALFCGMVFTVLGVGMAQLGKDEYDFWKDLVSLWWLPIPFSMFLMFRELLESATLSNEEDFDVTGCDGVFDYIKEKVSDIAKKKWGITIQWLQK